jgi:IS5 family transposase
MTKNKERHYGYKNHVKADKKSKIITGYTITSAEVHDSKELGNLINTKKDKRIYGDSAYTGEEVQNVIPKRIKNRIHEKGYRNRPLAKRQERNNRMKSKIRARVEHVFAAMTKDMGGLLVRSIGIARATIHIGLMNLVYNMRRYTYIASLG